MTKIKSYENVTAGEQIRLFIPFLKSMSTHEAILLSYLVEKTHARKSEWLPFSIETLATELFLNAHKQTRLLRVLLDADLIEIKHIGMPGARHIRVKFENVSKLVG